MVELFTDKYLKTEKPLQTQIKTNVSFLIHSWFEMNCLLLEDPVRNICIQVFSQPLMVPVNAIARMGNCTTDSYPLRQSGFAVTVGQAVAEEYNVILFKIIVLYRI